MLTMLEINGIDQSDAVASETPLSSAPIIGEDGIRRTISGEPLPERLYGFVTQLNPLTPDSFSSDSFLLRGIHSQIVSDAERYRQSNFPEYPSRLSAVYAFADIESCKQAAEQHSRNTVAAQEFTLADHPHVHVVKVNMEIVNLAIDAYRLTNLDQGTIDRIWKAYWEGWSNLSLVVPLGLRERRTLKSGVIWQYLIEGKFGSSFKRMRISDIV